MLTTSVAYKDAWQNCLSQIQAQTSAEEFAKWFLPIVPLEFDGSKLRLRVPSKSFVDKIEGHYINVLRPLIAESFGYQTRLCYAVPKSEQPTISSAADSTSQSIPNRIDPTKIQNPVTIPGIPRPIPRFDPQLNHNYTFENFIEGECNRLVRSASMAVAINPGSSTPFNPLYIYGDSGLGKTHVAQAIGNEISLRHPELQVLYVAMSKFQSQFQAATIEKNIPNFIHFYQGVDVLILDDIQELSGKPGTQNAFFNIFNHLQMSGKQLVLISDKPPVELKDIEERLLTRFKWGLSAQIRIPDFQTKIKIIKAKAARLGANIPEDVINYLADNISANIREIEGAISSLVANTSFMGKKITISLAKEILKGYISLYQKEITIEHIIDTVCSYLNIDKERLNSAERTREVAIARQLAMYLAKQLTKIPLSAIGAAIGNRNHATVLHSCKTITNLIDTDQAFKLQVEELERLVSA
ncbi:MAG: chromosomal replication initiator protein DnaA [Alistipes sp.]|nr:chromosomal replication initiator protein DnaA [Alistipes sp.]MBQ7951996.1 chromosomal replication initiator protein DnaA [Alistipes sp.]